MKKFFLKTNKFYDGIKEPWRFLIVILILLPFILSVSSENINYILISVIWLSAATSWRLVGFALTSKSNQNEN